MENKEKPHAFLHEVFLSIWGIKKDIFFDKAFRYEPTGG